MPMVPALVVQILLSVHLMFYQLGTSEMTIEPDRRSSINDIYAQFKNKELVLLHCSFTISVKTVHWKWKLQCPGTSRPALDIGFWPTNVTSHDHRIKANCAEMPLCNYTHRSELIFLFNGVMDNCIITCLIIGTERGSVPRRSQNPVSSSIILLHNEAKTHPTIEPRAVRESISRNSRKEERSGTTFLYITIGLILSIGTVVFIMAYITRDTGISKAHHQVHFNIERKSPMRSHYSVASPTDSCSQDNASQEQGLYYNYPNETYGVSHVMIYEDQNILETSV